ncbi:MAG: hypothetical protein KC635_15985 [Myxococcales bacterium]|nr:hypothetical protein [Myxococcales bacterium]MCB9736642.1 hypothetical protein [Deltaproteobacteria bacterium]
MADAKAETKKKPRKIRKVGDKTAEGRRIEEEDLDPIELSEMHEKPIITAAKIMKPRKKEPHKPTPKPNIVLKDDVIWGRIEQEKPKVKSVTTVTSKVMDRPAPPKRRTPSIGSMQPNLGKK